MAKDEKSSRLDTLMPALIGLAGVVLGVLVTAGVAYLGDRSRRGQDERAARFLVEQEILSDAVPLLHFSEYGKLSGRLPVTIQWQAESPTLARYVSQSTWNTVSRFYTNLANNQQSLTRLCPTDLTKAQQATAVNARNEIRTDVKLAADAYYALSKTVIPISIDARLQTNGCQITNGH
jgi:hypothetical protein